MPKRNRLTGAEIRRLSSQKRLHSSLFSLSVAKRLHDEPGAVFIVSKKVSAKAVVRNLVKRRMRAALRAHDLEARTVYVLSAKPAASSAPYTLMKDEISQLIAKARSAK